MAEAVPLDPGGVSVVASPSGNSYEAPTTNPALQLAGALANTEPKAADFVDQLGGQLKARAEAAAHEAALKSSAPAYAKAVSDGSIQAGQNPWFVQAFNQDRAHIGSQQAAQALVADSQTWQEKSYEDGGVAYEARLTKAAGDIHTQVSQVPGMHPQDAEAGFQSGAAPVIAQAIAGNNAYQLQSIKLQKIQDNTTLMAGALKDAYTANPNASPSQLLAALNPILAKGASVGFQASELKQQAFNSVVNFAHQMQDPNLLDISRAPFQGGPALADIAGDNGKSYGEQLSYEAFQIEREANYQANNDTKLNNARISQEAHSMVTQLVADKGYDAFHMSPTDIQAYAQAHNISPEGFAEGAKLLDQQMEGLTGLTRNFTALNENSPAIATKLLAYKAEAAQKGLTPDFMTRVTRDVTAGNMTLAQADSLVAEGANTVRSQASTERQVAATDRATAHQMVVDARNNGHQVREDNNDYTANWLIGAGDNGMSRNPGLKEQLKTIGDAAHGAWLAAPGHANDYEGASKAQKAALNSFANHRAQVLHIGPYAGTAKAAPGGSGLASKGE